MMKKQVFDKHFYPKSLHKVVDESVCLANHNQSEVERIFETFKSDLFMENLQTEKILNDLQQISIKSSIDTKNLEYMKRVIEKMCLVEQKEPFQSMADYIIFVLEFKRFLSGLSRKLRSIVNDGLLKYCISFAEFCVSNVEFINSYEKIIRKNQPEITKEITDVEEEDNKFQKLTDTARSTLYHVPDIVSCAKKMRAAINKLYYLILEWTDDEQMYSNNLLEEMRSCKSDIHELEAGNDTLLTSIRSRKSKLAVLERQWSFLQKSHLALKKKLRRVQRSENLISERLKQLETDSKERSNELNVSRKRLHKLEGIKGAGKKRALNKSKVPLYKLSMEIHAARAQQREIETRRYRVEDNRIAINRHQERLRNLEQQLLQKFADVERQVTSNRRQVTRLQEHLEEDEKKCQQDAELLKLLKIRSKDLNFVFSKKNSPETLRQLKNHGKIQIEPKEQSLTETVCEIVVQRLHADSNDWQKLYTQLPILPGGRSIEQRQHDIDTIDRLAARHDYDARQQTKMALDKWRLFFHHATAEHLLAGLEKAHLTAVAKEVRSMITTISSRFEDDDEPNYADDGHNNDVHDDKSKSITNQ